MNTIKARAAFVSLGYLTFSLNATLSFTLECLFVLMNLVKRSREQVDPLVSMSKSSEEDLNLVKTKTSMNFVIFAQ